MRRNHIVRQVLAFFAFLFALLGIAFAAQRDTNATTTATAYTPRAPGDILVGNVGSVKTYWVAVGATTNDWIRNNSQGITTNFTIGTTTVYFADGSITNKS